MKKSRKKHKKRVHDITMIVIVVVAVIILAYSLTVMSKPKVSEAIATVNGNEITEQDLIEVMITVPAQLRQNLTQEILIEQAINIEIIQQEAAKLGLEVTDQEVEESIDQSLSSFGLQRQDFKEILDQQGVDEEALKSSYKKQLLALKFVNKTIHLRAASTS